MSAIQEIIDGVAQGAKRFDDRNSIALSDAARAELDQLVNDSKWCNEYHERLQNLRVLLNCSIDDLPKVCEQLRAAVADRDAAIERAVQVEREACENACKFIEQQAYNKCTKSVACDCAAAIRARGEKGAK